MTTPAGPGYHQYLCGLFRRLTRDFAFEWIADDCIDPTGYFAGRQRASLEEHFLRWLAEECSRNPRAVGLPPIFTYPAEVLTPLGPRTADWVRAVARDPLCGTDFFPWWSAELDHAFYRNRALARLWCDFPWRPPLTETEGEEADQIANDLATAFKLDPAGELPWPEWLELLQAIQADAAGERFCVTPTDPVLSVELWRARGRRPKRMMGRASAIGAIRSGNRSTAGGVSKCRVTSPASGTMSATGPRGTVRGRSGSAASASPSRAARCPSAAEALDVGRKSLPEGKPAPGINEQGVVGEAVYGPTEDDGRTVYRLSGVAGTVGEIAVCNIYIEDAADRDWAVQTWQTLRHGG